MADAARKDEALAEPTVLLAEDDRAFREMIASALEISGFRALAAASGSEALDVAEAEGFDLLIADVVMPGMSGPELAERLRAGRPGLPVIFISGYTEDALREGDMLPARATLLRKPFDPDELTDRVRYALTPPEPASADDPKRDDA